ncbi:MAG: hypothetical protein ABIZ09_09285 [Rhodoferax sp.]
MSAPRAMFDRFRRIREPYRIAFIAILTVLVCVACVQWPSLQWVWWVLFLGAMAVVVFFDVNEPVNYTSIRVSTGSIAYVCAGRETNITFDGIRRLELVKEEAMFPDLDGPYIESKWLVQTENAPSIEIMDESPHRKLLMQAFESHLPGFDVSAARAGLRASGEGRWLCYVNQNPTCADR